MMRNKKIFFLLALLFSLLTLLSTLAVLLYIVISRQESVYSIIPTFFFLIFLISTLILYNRFQQNEVQNLLNHFKERDVFPFAAKTSACKYAAFEIKADKLELVTLNKAKEETVLFTFLNQNIAKVEPKMQKGTPRLVFTFKENISYLGKETKMVSLKISEIPTKVNKNVRFLTYLSELNLN